MMRDILMRRQGYRLIPADQLAEDDMLELSEGPFMVSVRKPRSIPHHRLYFACLNSICKSGGFDDGPEALHDVCKLECGCFKVIQLPSGVIYKVPDSTAFNRMDQQRFNQYFDAVISFLKRDGYWRWLSPDLREKLAEDMAA